MSDHEATDAGPTAAAAVTSEAQENVSAAPEASTDNLEDALFGDDDEDDEEQVKPVSRSSASKDPEASTQADANGGDQYEDDEDDEDQGIRRNVRRSRQRVASASASPPPAGANGLAAPPPLEPLSPARRSDRSDRSSRSGSPYGREGSQEMDDAALRQLEYKEDEDEDLQPDDNIEVAQLALPQLPVRHTKEHWLARIPHFLRYVTTPFEPEAWDEEQEEEMLRDEGFNSGFAHDEGATSLLRTSNTIRWRYTDQVDEDGAKVPESNARIVRWSDGTMSLQVGSELFDITQQTEKGRVSVANTGANTPQLGASSQSAGPSSQQLLSQATQSVPMGSSGSSNRPSQSLSYLVVPHEREQVMESQGPIAGSLAFTPADTQSETHRRIAKALRFQKTARVVATTAGEGALDPEVEKARIEKELKDAEKKRIRERQKADRKSGKFDDDMFDIESRRRSRYVGGRKLGAGPRNADYYSDESDLGGGVDDVGGARGGSKRSAAASQRYAEDDDDGFIVDDEGDDEEDEGQGRGGRRKKKRASDDEDAMEVDDEPDEMELAERKIEEAEKARKRAAAAAGSGAKQKPRRPEPSFSSDEDDDDSDNAAKDEAVGSQTIAKKKRIVESDEE